METAVLDEVHHFWFGDLPSFEHFPEEKFPLWFIQSDDIDANIRERFGASIRQAIQREWKLDRLAARHQLGLIVLLDQLPRNAFRGTPDAYAGDRSALKLAREIAARGFDDFKLIERLFLILPFGHSENLADQDQALSLADQHYFPFADPAHFFTAASRRQSRLYRDIIARFGRFPHRNAVLGRHTSADEARFMSETNLSPV